MSQDVLLERKSSLKICLLFFILQFPKKISSGMFFAPFPQTPSSARHSPLPQCASFIYSDRLFLFGISMCSKLKQQQGNWETIPRGKNSQWRFKSNQGCMQSHSYTIARHKQDHCGHSQVRAEFVLLRRTYHVSLY